MSNATNTLTDEQFVSNLLNELDSLSTVTHSFTLPTKGKLDGTSGSVTLRAMTTHEEKIRVGSNARSFWKLMADLLNRCVVEPKGFDAYKLTVVDFIFLMYKLRIISYGRDYKVGISQCPHCNKPLSEVSVNLDELKVTYIDSLPKKYQTDPIKLKLPVTKWEVECKTLRINEYDDILNEVDRIYKEFPNYEGDPQVPLRLSTQITKINGRQLDKYTIQSLVEKLPAADENYITRVFDKMDMGIELTAKYTCPRCGKLIYIPLSYSEEFFRPTTD